MCLGIPGRVLSIVADDEFSLSGHVDFAGVRATVNLSFVPEVCVGDYVIVHVGFAISRLDEKAAEETFAYLRELESS